MKYISTLILLCFVTSCASTDANLEDRSYLIELVQQARNYFNNGSGCKPQYSFEDRMDLVNEFLTITDEEVKYANTYFENEITIFLERHKTARPGLHLTINLKNGKCQSFYIYELMN